MCFVNVNELLGFEIGDIKTGKVLHQVKVTGYEKGPVKRHGCPSHGIALTPDEKEIWLADGANSKVHIFDATVMPPKQTVTIDVRDQPGWITFSLDGRYGYPSTGEIIDTNDEEDRGDALGRGRQAGPEREGRRGRLCRRQADGHRRSVRHRPQAVTSTADCDSIVFGHG